MCQPFSYMRHNKEAMQNVAANITKTEDRVCHVCFGGRHCFGTRYIPVLPRDKAMYFLRPSATHRMIGNIVFLLKKARKDEKAGDIPTFNRIATAYRKVSIFFR